MEAESFENLFSGQTGSSADGGSPLQKLTRLVMIRPTARPPHTSFRWVFPYFERVTNRSTRSKSCNTLQLMPENTTFSDIICHIFEPGDPRAIFFSQAASKPTSLYGGEPEALDANAKHYLRAFISCNLGANNRFFQARQEKLEKWAGDKIPVAEQVFQDTKARIRRLKPDQGRRKQLATTRIPKTNWDLERLQCRQCQQVFDVECKIIAKCRELIKHWNNK